MSQYPCRHSPFFTSETSVSPTHTAPQKVLGSSQSSLTTFVFKSYDLRDQVLRLFSGSSQAGLMAVKDQDKGDA
ncbi:hypothetical protein HQ35_01430 [Porphyromonas cangingivalis]|uniref:Uncharacterized protein n=1 Tax=Porphyromonas cangingivalis TaxID=36874 RepID=A0A0A2EYZ9_PORCN|nr:hypothetical protein HQ35_01430 [Porphyromonas cangingivalis]